MSSLVRQRVAAAFVAAIFLFGAVGYAVGTFDDRAPSAVDLGFVQDMITHHEQAVGMANIALETSDDPSIRTIASEVVLTQMREIGIFDATLQRWGRDRKPYDADVMDWMGMPMPRSEMPGYADEVELDALRAASGEEFEALFLNLLAAHHVAATQMAAFAADNARDGGVADLARVIERNQSVEIAEYAQLAERQGLPAIPGSPTLWEFAALARIART